MSTTLGSTLDAETASGDPPAAPGWHRAVRLTARTSAFFFSAAQVTQGPGSRAARLTRTAYLAFMASHAVHFAVVARYAYLTRGRNLFPGGRGLADAGGWPTVLGIFSAFAGLALTGWTGRSPTAGPARRLSGRLATSLIAAMFVGTYAGKAQSSRWYAAPAVLVAASTIAGWRRSQNPTSPRTSGRRPNRTATNTGNVSVPVGRRETVQREVGPSWRPYC